MKTRITIAGAGAVSPAGWGLSHLHDAVVERRQLETAKILPPGSVENDLRAHNVLRVPRPIPDRSLSNHPRMRRASPITLFAAAAAIEALGGSIPASPDNGGPRLGIVYTLMNGCVGYSQRFYGEVLQNPATASPILFPETVFNAPASHLAAYLGVTGPVHTLIGDAAQFMNGLDLAAMWLDLSLVEACLVVGAEELDWLTAEGLGLLQKGSTASEGAGCLLISRESKEGSLDAELCLREDDSDSALQVDSRSGKTHTEAVIAEAMNGASREVFSPLSVLGNGMGASCAWQCALAWQLVTEKRYGKCIAEINSRYRNALSITGFLMEGRGGSQTMIDE